MRGVLKENREHVDFQLSLILQDVEETTLNRTQNP